jgi:aminomethyltransferase
MQQDTRPTGVRWALSRASARASMARPTAIQPAYESCILAADRSRSPPHVSIGTPFHPRTAPLNRKMQWREWSGYFASSVYADAHDIEYNAIREAAALIDVSPLYKYIVSGPDALRLVDRVVTRDATKLAVGGVMYTPWCDEHGKVVDDGTIHRLDEARFRWTAADPQLRWLRQNSAGLDVTITEETEATAALALQGPLSRDILEAVTGESFADLRYFRRRAAKIAKVAIDVSRTGYTGDLGYELWIPTESAVKVWDALVKAGADFGLRPAGMLALDVVRLEAGLILLEVDYTSARHAMNPEQNYSPGEIGLGRLVSFDKGDFVGRLALEREAKAGGPARRLVGLQLDWYGIEGLYDAQGLPPAISPSVDRSPVPVWSGGRQVGRATSHGWSPILKQAIALASVEPRFEPVGTKLAVEWTVEGRRGRVDATVVELPFLDLPRKRA